MTNKTKTPTAKIVIVDDSAVIRSLLRSLLSNEGHKIVNEHSSGRNLLASIEEHKPDVICLDYNLPEVDGLELLKEIHIAYPTVAVVMITGNKSSILEKSAAGAGASGFIHKPFTPEKIIRDIHQVILAQKILLASQQVKKSHAETSTRASVVIADDSSTMRMLLAAILAEANFNVVGQACDGKQAIELVTKHSPDFACLDIEMPVMTGLEALSEINLDQPNTKALMITSSADRDRVILANEMGAKGYIIKPYHPKQIINAMTKLL